MNKMRDIRVEKVTLNIGTGKDQEKLKKALILLEKLTTVKPVKTVTNKRIATWGLRPGLPIGCKVTVRDQRKREIIKRLLSANDNILSEKQFDNNGNLAFGIEEYINIAETKYIPEVGMMGLEACVTLQRPGFRVKKRRLNKAKVGQKHRIKKEEAITFMKEKFKVEIGEKE